MNISPSTYRICTSPCSSRKVKGRNYFIFHILLVVVIYLTSFASCGPSNSPPIVTTFARGNNNGDQKGSDVPKDSLMYIRVMKKMDTFCGLPYKESDDQRIDMYSKCFSQLIKAVSVSK